MSQIPVTGRLVPLALVVLAACAALAACASPEPPAPEADSDAQGFDGPAWLAEAERVGFDPDTSGYDSPATARAKALADSLDAEVDWRRACNTEFDPETEQVTHTPRADDEFSWARGTLRAYRLSDMAGFVSVTCDFGAYQGSYALVRADSSGATIVRAPALDLDGRPLSVSRTTFNTVEVDPSGAVTETALDRGLGDCGTRVTYRPAGRDSLAIETVRRQPCDATPEPVAPEAWPVVYEAG